MREKKPLRDAIKRVACIFAAAVITVSAYASTYSNHASGVSYYGGLKFTADASFASALEAGVATTTVSSKTTKVRTIAKGYIWNDGTEYWGSTDTGYKIKSAQAIVKFGSNTVGLYLVSQHRNVKGTVDMNYTIYSDGF